MVEHRELILGNTAVERAAVEFVIEQERLQGRSARDTRNTGAAGDVESDGRIIEVKASSQYALRSTGLLYFTAPQLRHGSENSDYYVYVVENVAQGDRSKFELRILHGEHLHQLFAGAKPNTFYVPVRAADYARLTRLGGSESESPDVKTQSVRSRKGAKPILDTVTGIEYSSMYQAGKALYALVGGDVKDQYVWYKIVRAFPGRFLTKNDSGDWVGLNDSSVPPGSTSPDT